MTTRTPDEIDLSTFPTGDGEPMAETFTNQVQMTDLIFTLGNLLEAQGRTRYAVGGNQFLYYNPHNRRDNLSPDVYVALDVRPGRRNVWFTWVEGKCPDIVFEITSPSTQEQDLSVEPGGKRRRYAELGAREYYIYDPQPALVPLFLGYEVREGQFEPLPLEATGGIVSPLLRAELRPQATEATDWRPAGVYLRVVDVASGRMLPTIEETHLQARQEEQARRTAELRASQEEQARHAAEQALRAAEQRAAAAEAALAALRAQRQDTP